MQTRSQSLEIKKLKTTIERALHSSMVAHSEVADLRAKVAEQEKIIQELRDSIVYIRSQGEDDRATVQDLIDMAECGADAAFYAEYIDKRYL
jgi:uncharacterized coiled-coil protein SlyX